MRAADTRSVTVNTDWTTRHTLKCVCFGLWLDDAHADWWLVLKFKADPGQCGLVCVQSAFNPHFVNSCPVFALRPQSEVVVHSVSTMRSRRVHPAPTLRSRYVHFDFFRNWVTLNAACTQRKRKVHATGIKGLHCTEATYWRMGKSCVIYLLTYLLTIIITTISLLWITLTLVSILLINYYMW